MIDIGLWCDKQVPVTAEENSPIDLLESESETQSARHIIDIPVDHIEPHPDNPRKDVGDVTELADSIKANGIMQNLTVVPWFSTLTGKPTDNNKMDGYYRVIIGHRRLAAAKMAGLETVPCVLSDADRKQQIAIMLAENMQRTDLTIIEQADGIQMMFDMGADIDEVSEKTGLSKTTVRRRTKLLEYDRDTLKGAMERGATFADYDKLNQIKSIARRNEVLETIGTSNFTYKLNSAITAEKSETGLPIAEKWLSGFAEKVKSYLEIPTGTYHYFKTLYPQEFADENYVERLSLPPSVGELKYLYYINGSRLELYQEWTKGTNKTDSSAEEAAQPNQSKYEQQRKRKAELDQINTQMYQMRYDWVKDWHPSKSNAAEELKALTEAAITASIYELSIEERSMADILGIAIDDIDEDADNYISQVINRIMTSDIPMHKIMLAWIYTTKDNSYQSYHSWSAEHDSNEELDLIYKLLVALGYPMSDAEIAYQNGTHDAFKDGETDES